MTAGLVVSDVRTPEGVRVDIVVVEGFIERIVPSGTVHVASDVRRIEGRGRLVHGTLVEPHAHLDKAFLARRVPNPSGDLAGAIEAMERAAPSIDADDVRARAHEAVDRLVANGVSSVRTHVDTTLAGGLGSLEALVAVREARRDEIDIQVAALLDWPLTGPDGVPRHDLALAAVETGADVIGGCPHLDTDPRGAVEWLVDFALEHSLPLDLHADENLRPDSRDLETLADVLLSVGVRHDVVASHCVSLSMLPEAEASRIAEKVAEAGVGVVALPQTNLYLQARSGVGPRPRGITPVGLLARAGVRVAAGGDNLQDPFNPMGRGDPYETAALMVLAGHALVHDAFAMVSSSAAAVIDSAAGSPVVGSPAHLVLVDAFDVREALAETPRARTVIRSGRVVAGPDSDRK